MTVSVVNSIVCENFHSNRQIKFDWKLLYVTCSIQGTSQSCADYMANLPEQTQETCNVNVVYDYTVQNIGDKCVKINSGQTKIDGISTSLLSVQKFSFCPQEKAILQDTRMQNLCDYSNQEIGFEITLNGKQGAPGESSIQFPTANTIPLVPSLEMNSFKCLVNQGLENEVLCQNYIQDGTLPTVTTVVLQTKITNNGSACINIKRANIVFVSNYPVDLSNWSDKRKKLCPFDSVFIRHPVPNVDLNSFAGREIDYTVKIIDENNSKLEGEGSLLFPVPQVLETPTKAPVLAPVPAPVKAPVTAPVTAPTGSVCSSKAKSIVFKFVPNSCSDNNQGIRRANRNRRIETARGKGGKGGKGASSVKTPGTPPGTSGPQASCNSCTDNFPMWKLTKSLPALVRFSTTINGSKVVLSSGDAVLINGLITFDPSNFIGMPDCLEVEIFSQKSKKIQKFSIDLTCSSGSSVNVGDSFGALQVVSIGY